MAEKSPKKKIKLAIAAVLLAVVAFFAFPVIRLGIGAYKEGFFEKVEKREYTGNSLENLKAIHTALTLYQDSEGALPQASGWMDAAWSRLQTADMTEEEERKKLKADGITAEDEYGYGFNIDAGGKHTLDLPEDMVLIFESKDLSWNSTGKPENPGAKGITVAGKIVDLK